VPWAGQVWGASLDELSTSSCSSQAFILRASLPLKRAHALISWLPSTHRELSVRSRQSRTSALGGSGALLGSHLPVGPSLELAQDDPHYVLAHGLPLSTSARISHGVVTARPFTS